MTKVILVEDDEKLSSLIQRYLQQNHFDVDVINDGNVAADTILCAQPDLVILDLMLPGTDGLAICRKIRAQFGGFIIFLTASEDDMDHVVGVELGADDFIIKPIQPRVLLARMRMLLRRNESNAVNTDGVAAHSTPLPFNAKNSLSFGSLSIHHSKRTVLLGETRISLTTSEFDLLWLLASHAEQVLSREFLYQSLRGIEYDGMDRAMDTKVANLRRKLGDNATMSTRILTVRGQGYLFIPDSWD